MQNRSDKGKGHADGGSETAVAARVLERVLADRGVAGTAAGVGLTIDPSLGAGGCRLADVPEGVAISGGDLLGLLHGAGRFLQTSRFGGDGFTPSTWRGTSRPACSIRGLYMAHNFDNWNTVAPVDELVRYIEELALWGLNTLAFNFGLTAIPAGVSAASAQLERSRAILQAAKGLGIKIALLYCPNTGFGPVPEALRAEPFPDADPPRRGFSPTGFVCTSKPEGRRFACERLAADLDRYRDISIDYVVSFPYDAGGCGCAACRPWGARGYVGICKALSKLARERWPDVSFVMGTWCFDVVEPVEGEYAGLDRELRTDRSWCDVIMDDAHGDFPRYPLEHGVPGGLPMINFAEISMWGRYPWGGSGANPYPARIARLWRQAADLLDGGLPYSEGCYTDLNAVCCLQLDWDKDADTAEVVRRYAAFAFGAETADAVGQAIALMEKNYPPSDFDPDAAHEALRLLREAETRMTEHARTSWRWRILLLRAVIDAESAAGSERDGNPVSAAQNDAYEELTRLYHAEGAGNPVAPRSRSFYARGDVDQKGPVFAEHIGEHASDPRGIR